MFLKTKIKKNNAKTIFGLLYNYCNLALFMTIIYKKKLNESFIGSYNLIISFLNSLALLLGIVVKGD